MEKKEVKIIIDKIKAFRQNFDVSNLLIEEWTKILLPYRYQDVDKRLDEYFKENENTLKYPDAYYLTKYLRTEEEINNTQEVYVRCPICSKIMNDHKLHEHYERCSSIEYIERCGRKYLNKVFNRMKMWEMSKDKFEELYWKVCDETFKVIPECLEKHTLENAILTHNGKEPKYSIEELNKMLER